MKMIPIFKVHNMAKALRHYTEVLDFVVAHPDNTSVIDLANGEAEFQLTTHESDQLFGSVANVWVDDVDELFAKYKSRGLDTSGKENSPIEQGPVDQTWGTREFYVKDADGNCLRFVQANRS
jgi:uncharacterized glyoxalase superfamily protein PhnB